MFDNGFGVRRPAAENAGDAAFRIEVLGGAVSGPPAEAVANELIKLATQGPKGLRPVYR